MIGEATGKGRDRDEINDREKRDRDGLLARDSVIRAQSLNDEV